MPEQTHQVDRAGGHKRGEQHGVHHGLQNRPGSMNENRVKSPKVCFSADSYLVYGIRRDSRRYFSGTDTVGRAQISGRIMIEVRAAAMAEQSDNDRRRS